MFAKCFYRTQMSSLLYYLRHRVILWPRKWAQGHPNLSNYVFYPSVHVSYQITFHLVVDVCNSELCSTCRMQVYSERQPLWKKQALCCRIGKIKFTVFLLKTNTKDANRKTWFGACVNIDASVPNSIGRHCSWVQLRLADIAVECSCGYRNGGGEIRFAYLRN